MDFKTKWYDLTNETEINEFVKDTSAIANTPGLHGFIVIGYGELVEEDEEGVKVIFNNGNNYGLLKAQSNQAPYSCKQ